MKLSKRLLTIANYVDKEDSVIDVGCDHGYLDIYLALNKNNKQIIACDISPQVIETTKNNISNYKLDKRIKVYCTDGLTEIKDEYDTIILAGLGAYNIINIIKKDINAQKIIIQSNNHWELIRDALLKRDFKLVQEKLVYEKQKMYSIMVFNKGKGKLSKKEKTIGLYNIKNREEYLIWINIIEKTLANIPPKYYFKRLRYQKQIKYLRDYLKKTGR